MKRSCSGIGEYLVCTKKKKYDEEKTLSHMSYDILYNIILILGYESKSIINLSQIDKLYRAIVLDIRHKIYKKYYVFDIPTNIFPEQSLRDIISWDKNIECVSIKKTICCPDVQVLEVSKLNKRVGYFNNVNHMELYNDVHILMFNHNILERLQTLVLWEYNTPLDNVLNCLVNLNTLILGANFNRQINPNDLPNSLTYLGFGDPSDQRTYNHVRNPDDLYFSNYNQPFGENSLPDSLTYLNTGCIGSKFNQELKYLNKGLKKLTLGTAYNTDILNGYLPDSLKELNLENLENNFIITLPKNLKIIKFMRSSPQLLKSISTSNLITIHISSFPEISLKGSFPKNLRELNVHITDRKIADVHLDYLMGSDVLPNSLIHLECELNMLSNIIKPIVAFFPTNLKKLTLDNKTFSSIELNIDTFPRSLKFLSLQGGDIDYDMCNIWPFLTPLHLDTLKLRSSFCDCDGDYKCCFTNCQQIYKYTAI